MGINGKVSRRRWRRRTRRSHFWRQAMVARQNLYCRPVAKQALKRQWRTWILLLKCSACLSVSGLWNSYLNILNFMMHTDNYLHMGVDSIEVAIYMSLVYSHAISCVGSSRGHGCCPSTLSSTCSSIGWHTWSIYIKLTVLESLLPSTTRDQNCRITGDLKICTAWEMQQTLHQLRCRFWAQILVTSDQMPLHKISHISGYIAAFQAVKLSKEASPFQLDDRAAKLGVLLVPESLERLEGSSWPQNTANLTLFSVLQTPCDQYSLPWKILTKSLEPNLPTAAWSIHTV